jgi:hypothetical protein
MDPQMERTAMPYKAMARGLPDKKAAFCMQL